MLRLYLVRHGQSVGNIVEEDMPDAPLTVLGKHQAELVADYLMDCGIDHIVASPLVRALATAQPLAQELGLPIHVWRELVEIRHQGRYTGPRRQELQERFPEAQFGPEFGSQGWIYSGDDDFRRGSARVEAVKNRLLKEYLNRTVAVFAHGTFNQFFLRSVLGIPHASNIRFHQGNGCVNVINFCDDITIIHSINELNHLEAEGF